MALDIAALQLLQRITAAHRGAIGRVLSLGYPDIMLDRERAREMFGVDLHRVHPQNDEARKRHGCGFDLVDTEEFFDALGATLTCVDYKVLRGNEIVANLNDPCDLGDGYDLVIDPGTLEHCFNIAQAAANVAACVAPGGYVLHGNPVSMVNHGFYMLSPTWFVDWYGQNGWELMALWITDGKNSHALDPKERTQRIRVPAELSVLALARKPAVAQPQPMRWPIQTKYLRMQGA